MDKKTRRVIALITVMLAVAAFVAGLFLLPETLVIQIGKDGQPSNTAPRLLGLLLPFGLTVVFIMIWQEGGSSKSLIAALVGVVAYILVFVFNL